MSYDRLLQSVEPRAETSQCRWSALSCHRVLSSDIELITVISSSFAVFEQKPG